MTMTRRIRRSPNQASRAPHALARCLLHAGLALALGWLPAAQALGLLQAYELATLNDPAFQAARASHAAGQENIGIGRAGLLPQVSLSYQNAPYNKQKVFYEADGFSDATERSYSSYSASVTLTQPLFDAAAWARWKQGKAYALLADAQFRDAAQALAMRLLRAYTEALFAQDQVSLTRAQRDTYAEQLQRNRRAFQHGEGTRTDIAETEARLQLAQVALLDAEDAANVAWQALMQIVGVPEQARETLEPLRPDFVESIAPGLATQPLEDWQKMARTQNAALETQRQAVEAARHELSRQRAGHLPTVRLFAQHSRNKSEIASAYNQKYRTNSVGVMVSVPLFAGGGISAASRQAGHQLSNASYTLGVRTNEVMLDLERQYRLSHSGPARIRASQQAVRAAEVALEGGMRGVAAGERINLDVLNAAQQLYTARRDLARAVYDTLNARLALKYRAGVVSASDLREVAGYFRPFSDSASVHAATAAGGAPPAQTRR